MKGIHLGGSIANTVSLRNFKLASNACIKQEELYDALSESALQLAECVEAKTEAAQDQLGAASLDAKREVLRYMKIIPTPIAAAYMGTTEDVLNKLKHREGSLFGADYAGSHCYSMEELNLIVNNPYWLATFYQFDERGQLEQPHVTDLDYVVMVDEQTAAAFTEMTPIDLATHARYTAQSRRPYRLSDLEKIRVAKLNTST